MSSSNQQSKSTAAESEIQEDARELGRSVRVNIIGYALKIVHPLMFGVVAWLYGTGRIGIFGGVEAALLLLLRIGMLGLDKSLLWWLPQRSPENRRQSLPSALLLSGVTSGLFAAVLVFGAAPWIAEQFSSDSWSLADRREAAEVLRWMAPSLPAMAIADILIHASLAQRKVEAQSILKEGIVPIAHVLIALLMFAMGQERVGLGIAFVISQAINLGGAMLLFRRNYRGSSWLDESWIPPSPLLRYTIPLWLSELTVSFLLRMDVLVLGWLGGKDLAGVYMIVARIANAMRTVRRSFDPIVTAIIARIGARPDISRLRASFSHATSLVIATQMPVYAVLFCFTSWLLPLLDAGREGGLPYAMGHDAVLILCAFWVANGVLGLNGFIVSGFGRSGLTLFNAIAAVAFQGALLWLLIPSYGLEGVAVAVGLAYTGQNVLQAIQARYIAGGWPYNRGVGIVVLVSLGATAAMAAAWVGLSPLGGTASRIGGFVAFLLVGGSALLTLKRAGKVLATP